MRPSAHGVETSPDLANAPHHELSESHEHLPLDQADVEVEAQFLHHHHYHHVLRYLVTRTGVEKNGAKHKMAQPYSLLGSKIWLSLSESSISGSRLSTKNYNLSAGKPTPFYVYMYFAPYSVSSSSSRAWVEALPSSNQTAGIKELGISHGPSSTDH